MNVLKDYAGDLNIDARGGRIFRPFIVSDERTGTEIVDDGSSGWSFILPEDVPLGEVGVVGVDGFNNIGFIFVNGRVLRNMTAEDYIEQTVKLLEDIDRRRHDLLARNRDDWTARESYLSEELRSRLQYFRDHGESFELEGWGYELVIAELTDYLVASNLEETADIKEYCEHEGCCGNQYDAASWLAREILAGNSIEATPAALAPLGSGVYY